jgi:hypothetical protein
MSRSRLLTQSLDASRIAYIVGAAAACVLVLGIFAEDPIAYLMVAIPTLLPLFLWLRAGAYGVPVLPAASALFFGYYAVPLLRSNILVYEPDQLLWGAATVGSFLIAASLAFWLFLSPYRRRSDHVSRNFASDAQTVRLVFLGIGGGILFHLAALSNILGLLGPSSSVFRSIALTFASVGCYLLGHARARGILTGRLWILAVAALTILGLLSASSLIVVGAAMYSLAALLGYVVTARRIPWFALTIAFSLLTIFHAGKAEMRNKYWSRNTQAVEESSILQIPALSAEWVAAGFGAIVSGETKTDVFERVSLLHMLLFVQQLTPNVIPYLDGETYALLPSMLVPRFLDPDKTESQAGMIFLSVRYGLQPIEATSSTTIAWGLIAEAYANFGYLGAIAIGAIFGALCGALTRLSAGAAPNSVSMFVTIAATTVLLDLDADFSSLAATLEQSVIAILILAAIPSLLKGRPRVARGPRPAMLRTNTNPLHDASLPGDLAG